MIEQVTGFAKQHGHTPGQVKALAGDVSDRLYFRLSTSSKSWIVCSYPRQQWSVAERFLATTTILTGVGIRVPAVLAVDSKEQMILQEDLGETTWYVPGVQFAAHDTDRFTVATQLISKIRQLDLTKNTLLLPPLDASMLAQELEASLAFMPVSAAGTQRDSILRRIELVCAQVIENISSLPLEPAHRDFMVRNLVPMPNREIAVIDHQDLRLAPRGYDFVSLMNDSLFPPLELVRSLRRRTYTDLNESEFHWLAAQRTFKAVGSYCRAAAEGNPTHLTLVRPTLHRFLDHLQALPVAKGHASALAQDWLPGLDNR